MYAIRYYNTQITSQFAMLGAHRLTKYAATPIRGFIYCPGGNGSDTSWQDADASATNPGIGARLTTKCVETAGRRMMSFASEWTWGNDTAAGRIDNLWSWGKGFGQLATSKIHLFGISMGTVCALNWAYRPADVPLGQTLRDNRSVIASIQCALPACDLGDIEDNGRVSAYSLPNPSTGYSFRSVMDVNDPGNHASAYSSIPMKFYASSDDTICDYTAVSSFCTASGATLVNLGAHPGGFIPGHNCDNLNVDDVLAFMVAND